MQIGSGTYARVFTDKQNNEILLRVEDILPDNPLRDAKMTIKLQKQLAVHGIAPELYESFEVPRDRHDRKEVKKFLVTVMERYSCDLMSFIKTKESDTTLLGMNIAHLFKRLAKRHIMCADLKPQNIVLNSKMIDGVLVPMEMRLIDFGADFCDVDVFGVLDGYVFSDNFDNEYTLSTKEIENTIYLCLLFLYFLIAHSMLGGTHTNFCIRRIKAMRRDEKTNLILQAVGEKTHDQNFLMYLAMKKLLLSNENFKTMVEHYNKMDTRRALELLYELLVSPLDEEDEDEGDEMDEVEEDD